MATNGKDNKWLATVAKTGDYNDLINVPSSLPANGGNSDTVAGKTIDDSKTSTLNLWTADKINSILNTKSEKNHVHEDASPSVSGFMSVADKAKLDGIQANANNYVHPSNHPATIITEDSSHRFVTDTEKSKWNAKAENTVVSSSTNGLMSKEDKVKLDGIQANANNYTHPSTHAATMITEDSNHRFVSDTEKSKWNAKAENTIASSEANGLMSKADKAKLDSIGNNANNYVHPSTHAATMITEDSSHRFVTDTEKSKWNAKAETTVASSNANGLMSKADKAKLDGIEANANNYTHPSNHPATMITEDSSHRFVTDTEKSKWNDKYTKSEIDNKISQVITDMDWKKSVATFNDIARTYPRPEDGWTVSVDDTDITYRYNGTEWISISANAIPMATSTVDGKMSKADKAKLDNIATGANKYIHPSVTKNATTSNATPTSGATFTAVDSVTTNSEGHVTAVNTKTVTIPSNSNTATKLATARTINGVAFDGSANITIKDDTKFPIQYISTATDLDTLTSTGIYSIAARDNINAPVPHHITVLVDYTVGTHYQICIPDVGTDIYKRTKTSSWGKWIKLTSKECVGLGNVDNTSDKDKPISTATQNALNDKANASHTHQYAGSSSVGGSANSAIKLATARTIALTGNVTGSANFDGSGNITINTSGISSIPTSSVSALFD